MVYNTRFTIPIIIQNKHFDLICTIEETQATFRINGLRTFCFESILNDMFIDVSIYQDTFKGVNSGYKYKLEVLLCHNLKTNEIRYSFQSVDLKKYIVANILF